MMTGRAAEAGRAARGLVLVALVVAACGGTSSGDTTDPSEGGGTGTGETVDEAPTETAGTEPDEEEPETLSDYLGYDFDDPEAAAARAMEDQRRVEESIARCMAQEGFEYIPAVRPASSSQFAFDQEEYAREQGFGITTWYGREDSFLGRGPGRLGGPQPGDSRVALRVGERGLRRGAAWHVRRVRLR